MAQPGEQSVGEILDSIKKVMERDRSVGDPPPLADDDEPAPVLELTDAHLEPTAAPAPAPAAQEPLELREVEAAASRPAVAAAPSAQDAARASLRDLLAALTVLADPAPTRGVQPGETSLEGLVREMLRPMLAEWLDKNLPPLAEKLVAAEIARNRDRTG